MQSVAEIRDEYCYGCGACTSICATGGVTLTLNKDGYYKSQVHEDKCLHCGKCLTVCPAQSNPKEIPLSAISYVAYAKKKEDVWRSSSGGIGHLIAREYWNRDYYIIGAAWSRDFQKVHHIMVKDKAELDSLRKSKYVQSDPQDAFRQIAGLQNVIVFGTPCQIAGLRSLYGRRDGLILVDFDCMGPAGLSLWHKYMAYIKQRSTSPVVQLEMRYKKKSWMMYGTRIMFADGEEYFKDKFHDPFCVLYHFGRMIQETCLKHCKYRNASEADIRLGDAWHYTEGYTKEQIRYGLSVVTLLTKVGERVIQTFFNDADWKKTVREIQPVNGGKRQDSLFSCINVYGQSIEDALKLYDSNRTGGRWRREVDCLLSANDMLYLGIKNLLKHFR